MRVEHSVYLALTLLLSSHCTVLTMQGLAVCSARTHGIRGLGSEVVRQAETLAKEKGCSYTYLLATGNYSRRLFAGLGYSHLNTLTYSEFMDQQGELYLKDTREHIAATTWCKPL